MAFVDAARHDVCQAVPSEAYGANSIGDLPAGVYEEFQGTSVLLPLLPEQQYRPRVLTCGGRKAYTIDLSNYMPGSKANPPVQWRETGPRQLHGSPERRNLNAVLLPTGQVFVCGGVEGKWIVENNQNVFVRHNDDAVMNAELYDPISDSWEALERAQVVRNYHSVALLMPDGRVWTAGSNDNCEQEHNELRIEVYEPCYYGRPDRPEIAEVSRDILSSDILRIKTLQAADIQRVAILRTGSVTHAFNSDQRYIGLRF